VYFHEYRLVGLSKDYRFTEALKNAFSVEVPVDIGRKKLTLSWSFPMIGEFNQIIDSYIYQEDGLLAQLEQIQKQKEDIGTQITKEAASFLARGYFGRTGGKIARSLVEQGEKERINQQLNEVDRQHRDIVRGIHAFLSKVSEWNKNLKEPNSKQLLTRLDKAQEGVRVKTRVNATKKLLTSLKLKSLVYNTEIPNITPKEAVLAPGSPFRGLLELTNVFKSVTGYVKICDPWADLKTLEIFLSIPENVQIKFLTEKTGGKSKANRFKRACKAFQEEHPGFEIRKVQGLHDRFILTKKQGWSVGSSIKDFGKDFSALTPLSDEVKKDTETIFDELWKKARV